jgi:hypothetical protein
VFWTEKYKNYKSASADEEATAAFLAEVRKSALERGHCLQQVFT